MAPGPPSSYKEEYCEEIIELMREGKTLIELASHFNISEETIHKWKRVFPAFAEAVKKGKVHAQRWWIEQGKSNLENPKFNFVGWYMFMKNLHGFGDVPSHRSKEMREFGGTLKQKIAMIDEKFARGEITAEVYEKMTNAFHQQARIIEIADIDTRLKESELLTHLEEGKITREQFEFQIKKLKERKEELFAEVEAEIQTRRKKKKKKKEC